MMNIARGLDLMGEAYQASFDELREEIIEKDGLSFKDSIRLADFIRVHNLDETTALANINEDNADLLVDCLRKAEALSDASLYKSDVVILDKIIKDEQFNDNDLKEIIQYASGSDSFDKSSVSVRRACAYFEEELHKAVTDCLTYERSD